MWGTFILDVFQRSDAQAVRDALEELVGPRSGSSWATNGVYVFWRPDGREPLYVGIATDIPTRFAQHLGLRHCPAAGCKREEIATYFDTDGAKLGYTIVPLSNLSQADGSRLRVRYEPDDDELEVRTGATTEQALNEMRNLEGRLIEWTRIAFGAIPRWNTSRARIPARPPDADDGTMAAAVGAIDVLLQARKSIRDLAGDPTHAYFEECLHGARMMAVAFSVLGGPGFHDDMFRSLLGRVVEQNVLIRIIGSGYIDEPLVLPA
jgi:hypothetical protein